MNIWQVHVDDKLWLVTPDIAYEVYNRLTEPRIKPFQILTEPGFLIIKAPYVRFVQLPRGLYTLKFISDEITYTFFGCSLYRMNPAVVRDNYASVSGYIEFKDYKAHDSRDMVNFCRC